MTEYLVTATQRLDIYPSSPARFYDDFEIGTNKWERTGGWAIITLSDGKHALSDSPGRNYDSAILPNSRKLTLITSNSISLDGMVDPVLRFRHDYVLAHVGSSTDIARVEISTDNTTWTTLKSYCGGGVYAKPTQPTCTAPLQRTHAGALPESLAGSTDPEWSSIDWSDVEIPLRGYTGNVRLRFVLDVDQTVSDKGWLIDDVRVEERR